jgi:hypothetical protein
MAPLVLASLVICGSPAGWIDQDREFEHALNSCSYAHKERQLSEAGSGSIEDGCRALKKPFLVTNPDGKLYTLSCECWDDETSEWFAACEAEIDGWYWIEPGAEI